MDFMTTKEAVKKWNISERRIRQLLQEGRIEGAIKVGSSWNIPKDAIKPTDKRVVRPDNNEFIINLDNDYFNEVNKKSEKTDKDPVDGEAEIKNVDKSIYEILLIHEPDFIEDVDYGKFDLVLAGHSHNGQVRLPLIGAIIKPVGAETYYDEYYSFGNTDLYVSSGIGVSRVNFRLFNRPSLNFYRIVNH